MLEISTPQQNDLLAAFPAEVQSRLFPHLERVTLRLGEVLYEPDNAEHDIYFPAGAVLSLVTQAGASIEVSVVGNEGLVGVRFVFGGEAIRSRAIVQRAGAAYRLKGSLLKLESERSFRVMVLLLHYQKYLLVHVAQPTTCRLSHSIDQQLCHWLLLSLDRGPHDGLVMTQQLIANVLGVHRQGITDTTTRLLRAGVIGYSGGEITVVDRLALERWSCSCYAAIKQERLAARRRLLPYLPAAVLTRMQASTTA